MSMDGPPLKLTDFVDPTILQEIQDSFAAVAGVRASIFDAEGTALTQPAPSRDFLQRQRSIAETEATDGPQRAGREYVAPIQIGPHRFGTIRMKAPTVDVDEAKLQALGEKFGLELKQIKSINTSIHKLTDKRPAAIQFLYLLANAIAKIGYQEFVLRQRVEELTAIYNVTSLLGQSRDLESVLKKTVEVVCDVIGTRSSSIRLLDRDTGELRLQAAHNLSREYLAKGPIVLRHSAVDTEALSGKGYSYVADMQADARTVYPVSARDEGVVSVLAVGMRYQGTAIGVLRVYTEEKREFDAQKVDLLRSIAAQAAAAIENRRLHEDRVAAAQLEKQVHLAASVQRRLLPRDPPVVSGIELSSIYVPCYELGGDFFDFIPFPDDNVGIVVADVSGKGVPASLIMASVRSALRAQVDNLYYLYEAMHRLNHMLLRDSEPSEFVTLFYGVVDGRNRRLTYCSAGHPPGLLLRKGSVHELDTINMVLGVNPEEQFEQSILQLESGDLLLFYTDGLFDAGNFSGERFGRQRIIEAMVRNSDSAGALVHGILWEMRKFVGIARPTDDVTMVAMRVE
ncbi:MAG TPA: SpoIIE family protein phosphatase [Tepidisphaeraceae bacterium]|nr:SpoIIE family protein phosphatase [Tepidisphaeraceae bacterium]